MIPLREKPKNRNQRFELTGLAKPVQTGELADTGPVLARQDAADMVFEWVWNWTELLPAKSRSTLAREKLNCSTRKSVNGLQCSNINEDLGPEVSSSSFSVSTHHQEEQKQHRGYVLHTTVDKFQHLSQDFINCIHPSAKTNLGELVQSFLEFPTVEHNLVCHVLIPKQNISCQITDWSNTMID